MNTSGRADRRWRSRLATALMAATLGWALIPASAARADSTSPTSSTVPAAGPAAPTTTLPAVPAVDPSLTEGQPPGALLTRAVTLSSVGVDDTALVSALGQTQAHLDADAATARAAEADAARADAAASRARATAADAAAAYSNMAGAIRQAVTYLYTSGPATMTVDPAAGAVALYARDYAESTLGPYGVLVRARQTRQERQQALETATRQQKLADEHFALARRALDDQQTQLDQLQAEVRSLSAAAAAAVAADHVTLAAQAGTNLATANALQFPPKAPLPAPLSTTSVALDWAFAQLGKPYIWGATGPDTFDCSGLTQYAWRAAGVSIPRVAADQYGWTVPVPLSDLLPGDLVFFGTTDIHHVGVYIGNGLMINAPHTGDVVRVSSIWWSDLAGFGRVHFDGVPVPARNMPTSSAPAPTAVVPARGPVPSQATPPPGAPPVTEPPSTTTIPPAPTTTTTTRPAPGPTTTTTGPVPTTTVVPATTTSTTTAP